MDWSQLLTQLFQFFSTFSSNLLDTAGQKLLEGLHDIACGGECFFDVHLANLVEMGGLLEFFSPEDR